MKPIWSSLFSLGFVLASSSAHAQANMALNGALETDISSWYGTNGTTVTPALIARETTDANGTAGALRVSLNPPTGTTWYSHRAGAACQLNGVAPANATLRVQFAAKSLAGATWLTLTKPAGAGQENVQISASWQRYDVYIFLNQATNAVIFNTVTKESENLQPLASGTFLLDDVHVSVVPNGYANMAVNPHFESNVSPWVGQKEGTGLVAAPEMLTRGYGDTPNGSAGILKFDVVRNAQYAYHNHVTGVVCPMTSTAPIGSTLRVTFWAKRVSGGGWLSYSKVWGGNPIVSVQLASTWQRYDTHMTVVQDTAALVFSIVGSGTSAAQDLVNGTVLLDDVDIRIVHPPAGAVARYRADRCVPDAAGVLWCEDLSGNGHTASAPTAATSPLVQPNVIGGRPTLLYGDDEQVLFGDPSVAIGPAYTMGVVGQHLHDNATALVLNPTPDAIQGSASLSTTYPGGSVTFGADPPQGVTGGLDLVGFACEAATPRPLANGEAFVAVAVSDAAGVALQTNGASRTRAAAIPWSVPLDGVLGSGGLAGDGGAIGVAEALIYNRVLSTAELDRLYEYVSRHYGIARSTCAPLACNGGGDCAVCGDGVVSGGEVCDTGADQYCARDCSEAGGALEICDPTRPICARGRRCGVNNGANHGLAIATSVCEPDIGCGTAAAPPNSCGDLSRPCGLCPCTPSCAGKQCTDAASDGCGSVCSGFCGIGQIGCVTDEECPPQYSCVRGAGQSFGLDPRANLCLPVICAYPEGSVAPNCGGPTAPCGACPICVPDCSTKLCGSDGCGGSCGECTEGSDCLDSGQCLPGAPFPEIVTAPPLPASATKDGVGSTPGQFQVNDDGAAVYTIPIEAPPGRRGVQPRLAFAYNSLEAKNTGPLGTGWTITGLSSIARCAHTPKHDGRARGVMLDANDAYCLDGVRLVVVGTFNAGEVGPAIELRTELDSHVRILVAGTGPNVLLNPTSFLAILPDGTRRVYGGSTGFAKAANKRYLWALDMELSPQGDTIRYHYEPTFIKTPPLGYIGCNEIDPNTKVSCSSSPLWLSDPFTSALRLTRVDYGGRCLQEPCETTTLPDHLSIAFDYGEHEPDQTTAQKQAAAQDKVHIPGTTALSTVTTLVQDAPIREYRITYESYQQLATDRSVKYGRTPRIRVKTIQECTPGDECNKPHVFTYQSASLSIQAVDIADSGPLVATAPFDYIPLNLFRTSVERIYPLDANGDGITDLLWHNGPDWSLRLGGDDEELEAVELHLTLPVTLRHRDTASDAQTYMFSWEMALGFGDFDGDGADDVLIESPITNGRDDTRLDIYHFDDDEFVAGTRIDYRAKDGGSRQRHHHWTSYDADGDSWPDILICDENTKKWRVLWNDHGEFATEGGFDARGGCLGFSLLDFDADGVQEMVAYAPAANTTQVGYFHALKVTARDQLEWMNTHIVAYSRTEGASLVTLDADGDGRQDVLVGGNLKIDHTNRPSTNAKLWMNGVLGFYSSASMMIRPSIWGYNGLRNALIHDLDGNGADDVILPIQNQTSAVWRAYVPDPVNADLPSPTNLSAATSVVSSLAPFSFRVNLGGDIYPAEGGGFGTAVAADINGDGHIDNVVPHMFWINKDADIEKKITRYYNRPETNLLRVIDDGSGREQSIDYSQGIGAGYTVRGRIYEPAASCEDPDSVCLKTIPWGTVSHERRGDILREYTYTDARGERGGRGWLGYRQRMIRETWPNHEKITRIAYDHSHQALVTGASETPLVIAPFAGRPQIVEEVVSLPTGDLAPGAENVHHLDAVHIVHAVATSDKGIPFVFLDYETRTSHEESVDDVPVFDRAEDSFEDKFSLGAVSTVLTDFEVDEFANVALTTEATFAGDALPALQEKRVTRELTFEPTPAEVSAWHVRYPKDQLMTFEGGAGPAKTRFETYEYEGGFLKSLTRAFSRGETPFVSVEYTPNEVGNIESIEVSDPLQSEQRHVSFTYDSREVNVKEARYFPRASATPLIWSTDYSEAFGSLLVAVAPDDTVSKFSYDGLGRLAWVDEETGGVNGSNTVLSTEVAWFDDAVSAGAVADCLSCTTWRRETRGQGEFGTTPTGDSQVVVGFTPEGQPAYVQTAGLDAQYALQSTNYDATGRIVRQWAPRSSTDTDLTPSTIFEYDNLGRLVAMLDEGAGSIHYSYASVHTLEGSEELAQTPEGSWWLPESARWFAQGSNGTIIAMDAAGRTVAKTVGAGIVRTGYDGRDSVQHVSIDDDAAQTRWRVTDGWGRLKSQHDPDSGDYSYEYLGTGELQKETVPGDDVSYKYDAMGRITERTAGTEKQEFFWDNDENRKAMGHLLRASSGTTHRRFWYVDSGGKISGTQDTVNGSTFDVAYRYDANGRIDLLTYPQSEGVGLDVKHGYDSRGHLVSLRDNSVTAMPGQPGYRSPFWTFNEADRALRIRKETFGDGSSVTRTYDSGRGYLRSVQASRPSTPSKTWAFNYDSLGRASSTNIGATTRTIHHDAAGRLSRIDESGGVLESYSYATSGRITGSDQFASVSYDHPDDKGGPNAIASVSGYAYLYDERGNVRRREMPSATQEFVLNSFNLPTSVAIDRGGELRTAEIEYSALGDRVLKTIHDGDSADDPVHETTFQVGDLFRQTVTGASTRRVFRLYVNGREIGSVTKSGGATDTRYFVDDGVASPLAVSLPAGLLEITRRAYGEVSNQASVPTDARRFGGHEYDADLELVDMGGRLYDPHVGRFMSADPFVQNQLSIDSLNRYVYGRNDPLSYIDPTGFQSTEGQGYSWPISGGSWSTDKGPYGRTGGGRSAGTSTWSQAAKSLLRGTWHLAGGFSHAVFANAFVPRNFEAGDPEAFAVGQILGSAVGLYLDKQAVCVGAAVIFGGGGAGLLAEGVTVGASTVVVVTSVEAGSALVAVGVAGAVAHGTITAKALEQLHLAFSKGPPTPKTVGPQGSGGLSAGKNFKEHFISKRSLLERALGIKVGKLSEGGGTALLKAISEGINSGSFKYVGQGTLKAGQEAMNIYRGQGLTVVTRTNGEWVTLLKSGESLDLAVRILP